MNLRYRVVPRGDEGFSLMETMVAMGIAVIALLSLLGTSVYAVRTSVEARKNQQAGDLVNSAMEETRSLDYSAVTMISSNVAATTTDTRVNRAVTPPTFDPGTGAEPLDVRTVGSISPYQVTKATNNGSYVVSRYVTIPSTATFNTQGIPSVRRLTVVVTWTVYGKSHTRRAGTILTSTRRGLPQPYYTFKYNGPATLVSGIATWTKNPGNDVDYGFVVRNLGATDSWGITAISGTTTGWTYYRDTDQDGVWDETPTPEPALSTSPTVSGAYSSGSIQAGGAPVYVVAHRTIGALEVGTSNTIFAATSESQPTFPNKTVTTTLTVVPSVVVTPTSTSSPTPTATSAPANCNPGANTSVTAGTPTLLGSTNSSYTMTTLHLYNGPTTGDTTTQVYNNVGADASVLQTQACNFSTDQQTLQPGRYVDSSAVATNGLAEWRFQPSGSSQDDVRGTIAINFWVQCAGTLPQLRFQVGQLTGTTHTTLTSVVSTTMTSCSSTGFTMVEMQAPLTDNNGISVPTGSSLTFRVVTTQPVRLLYGTTSAAARIRVGLK